MHANLIDHNNGEARDDALRLLNDLSAAQRHALRTARLMVVGLGNIGSWLVEFLAGVGGTIVLVDRDRIHASRNCWNQFYVRAGDDGRPKAEAIAERLRDLRPDVSVAAYSADLNDVPWSEFARADLVLAGLDSLKARQQLINERCWPLGKTVIDGAVGFPLLGRVQIIRPGAKSACVECSWQSNHYRLAALSDPCNPDSEPESPPTRSPAFLGGTIAGIMAAEATQLLLGARDETSRQIDINLGLPRWTVSRMQRASGCRFGHEQITDRRAMPGGFAGATVDALRELVQAEFGGSSEVTFSRAFTRDAFGPQSTATVRELGNWSGRHLSDLGCTSRDWLLVRSEKRQAFIMLEPLGDETDGRTA